MQRMNWLLPLSLVLLVAILLAAIHCAFMRWMTRQPAPATVREPDAPESTEA
jgi:cell division protein FtsL